MFFEMIRRNSRRNRRENGLYFSTLVAAIVAFYVILSLENQDVMVFLRTMEGDAVRRLLGMVPVVYGVSLFLVFFLVYFASRYHMEQRSRDYGLYLLLGMPKRRLFLMLAAEDLLGSLMALLIGLPAALLISEGAGMTISRLIGLGIIGHRLNISLKAVLLTVAGFTGVKLLALFLLSGRLAGQELLFLLKDTREEKQKIQKPGVSRIRLLAGAGLLVLAYGLAISGIAWSHLAALAFTVVIGIGGTFLLFRGLSALVEIVMSRRRRDKGLDVFTFRQLQENVFQKSASVAVSSLLMLLALACAAFGLTMSLNSRGMEHHAVDFTFTGDEKAVRQRLGAPDVAEYVSDFFEMKIGLFWAERPEEEEQDQSFGRNEPEGEEQIHTFDREELLARVRELPESDGKRVLLNNLQYFTSPRLIALSGYNEILRLGGREELRLEPGEVMMYTDADFGSDAIRQALLDALQERPVLRLDGREYRLCDRVMTDNPVVDRSISISYGLILPDEDFELLTADAKNISSYWNLALRRELVEQKGLLQAVGEVDELLKDSGLTYESYLNNIGRQVFFMVGSGYMTVYLALIFLMIANTVIGVEFLMQQKKTGKRYRVLAALGSGYPDLCRSAAEQIRWSFGLPVAVAALSSIFGIPSLLSGLMTSALRSRIVELSVGGVLVMLGLCLIEGIYILAVKRLSDRHLASLMELRRAE